MSSNIKSNRGLRRVIHILTMLIVIFAITPFCRRNIPLIYIGILIVLWFILTFFIRGKRVVKTPSYIYFSIGWLVLIFGYRFLGFSDAAWGNYLNQTLFFIFIWIGNYYINNMGENYCDRIFKCTIFIGMANIMHNIYLLHIYPHASEELNFSDIYNGTNVGGTTLSLFALLLFCITLILITDSVEKTKKMIYLVLATVCIIYIFQASRATSIVFLIIAVFIYFYFKLTYKKEAQERIIFFIATSILAVLIVLNLEKFLLFISGKIDNYRLSIRLSEIANSLSGNNIDDGLSLGTRIELYKLSITTFFKSIKNFIIGVGYHTSTDLSLSWLYSVGVGNHSEFLDLTARYGIIGVLIIYNFFRNFTKKMNNYNPFNNDFKGDIVWIIFFLFSFVNNTFDPSIGVLLFLAFPIYLEKRHRYLRKEEVVLATNVSNEYKKNYSIK